MPSRGGGAATSAGIRFEQQLGAFFGSFLLSGSPLDDRLNLKNSSLVWLRFETEAPVDDILIATDNDGYIAVQAKTTVSLSKNLESPFGKVIAQFVRHWLACRDGDGSHEWNRPLDSTQDRLVLAVSTQAPKTIRLDLPSALRRRSVPGGNFVLTEAQKRALQAFDECVAKAWESITNEELDPALLGQLSQLITVFTFDPSSSDRALMITTLTAVLPEHVNAETTLNALEISSGQMMAERGGTNVADLRRLLTTKGIRLDVQPRYKQDIVTLREHTKSVAAALQSYEEIEVENGESVSVDRECQDAVGKAAIENSLLVIGEPGSGKSGVLNTLARNLLSQSSDVLLLAVDWHSVESLEGLAAELKLSHGLLEVLDAWDGAGHGWLIIDALDATRGGQSEGVFRTLIEQVMKRCERWHVVASIRTFDLRMGQRFRSLFEGSPATTDFADSAFSNVYHIRVPPWSELELQQLLDQAPKLSEALAAAPPRLQELATIPFNTRLLCELISSGFNIVDLRQVSSQVELLRLYWKHRIEPYGTPAQVCLRHVVSAMVEAHLLRVPKHEVALQDPAMIDKLSHEGVLIAGENDRQIQFRHHILFDFSAAQVLLDPNEIISGTQRFPKEQTHGLMLVPALTFLLQEIWSSQSNRAQFWSAVEHILADKNGDPVIRSATSRISAEYPLEATDVAWIAQRVSEGASKSIRALSSISGALALRMEDYPESPTEPWVKLLARLELNNADVATTVRFLLFQLIEKTTDASLRRDLGTAACALLEYGYGLEEPGMIVSAAIGFVADTYETDAEASGDLLSKVFDDQRFRKYGWQEVPAVCCKIEAIATADPVFGKEIYQKTYALEVTEEQVTQMGSSQILALTSTARQDYEMARYMLSEFVSTFLERNSELAIDAIVTVVEGYITRAHPIQPQYNDYNLVVENRQVRLREDRSHVWAHDPDNEYGYDANVLILKLFEYLQSSEEESTIQLANLLIDEASFAVFWSRLFAAAARRDDVMVALLIPFALTEQFLMMPDTRKDAIDVVAKGYGQISSEKRERFESQTFAFDFSSFAYAEEARENFLYTLFSTIGHDALVTSAAKDLLAENSDQGEVQNERPFVVRSLQTAGVETYRWIRDFDREHPSNANLMAAIDLVKETFALESRAEVSQELTLEEANVMLNKVKESLDGEGVNLQLKMYGESVIGEACCRILDQKFFKSESDDRLTKDFLQLLEVAARSVSPEVDDDTEDTFEEHRSWSSPAARVEGAQATLDFVMQRPDLLPQLSGQIDALLIDPHPAVRLQAMLHLIRIWDLDREGFWKLLNARFSEETNLGVLKSFIERILHRILYVEPELVEQLIFTLLERFAGNDKRQAGLRQVLAGELVTLWVEYERERAFSVIRTWIAGPTHYHRELIDILATMRGAYTVGLRDQVKPGDDARRHRAFELTAAIVDTANRGLAAYYSGNSHRDVEADEAKKLAQLLDAACRELYFAVGANDSTKKSTLSKKEDELRTFFAEAAPILEQIGDCATPHTVHFLLQLLEFLMPLDPARAFDLIAHALRNGGSHTGYEFESLGMDLMVRLVGVFLADYKEIFESDDRRIALIDCLEIFMNAGWPSAQRLLYRLPELIQ